MTPATVGVREEATLRELARFLLRAGIHRALVMEGGKLRGTATTMDVRRGVAGDVPPGQRRPVAEPMRG